MPKGLKKVKTSEIWYRHAMVGTWLSEETELANRPNSTYQTKWKTLVAHAVWVTPTKRWKEGYLIAIEVTQNH